MGSREENGVRSLGNVVLGLLLDPLSVSEDVVSREPRERNRHDERVGGEVLPAVGAALLVARHTE